MGKTLDASGVPVSPQPSGPPNEVVTSGNHDWTQVEFAASIVQNGDGSYGAGYDGIYSDDSNEGVNFGAPSGALGFWHNHDGAGRTPTQQNADRYPSSAISNPGGANDWDDLLRFRSASVPDPVMYITDASGITREFHYSERAAFESLTSDQMQAGEGLAGRDKSNAACNP
jgi:hypothetical protein